MQIDGLFTLKSPSFGVGGTSKPMRFELKSKNLSMMVNKFDISFCLTMDFRNRSSRIYLRWLVYER